LPRTIRVVRKDRVPAGVNVTNRWAEAHKSGDHDALRGLPFGRPRQAYSTIDNTPAFDAKLDPADCTHGQFLDAIVGQTVLCLDCGEEVEIAPQPDPDHPGQLLPPWTVKVGGQTLTDDELQEHRDRHDLIWYGDGTPNHRGVHRV
jgi:hypothetical protein